LSFDRNPLLAILMNSALCHAGSDRALNFCPAEVFNLLGCSDVRWRNRSIGYQCRVCLDCRAVFAGLWSLSNTQIILTGAPQRCTLSASGVRHVSHQQEGSSRARRRGSEDAPVYFFFWLADEALKARRRGSEGGTFLGSRVSWPRASHEARCFLCGSIVD